MNEWSRLRAEGQKAQRRGGWITRGSGHSSLAALGVARTPDKGTAGLGAERELIEFMASEATAFCLRTSDERGAIATPSLFPSCLGGEREGVEPGTPATNHRLSCALNPGWRALAARCAGALFVPTCLPRRVLLHPHLSRGSVPHPAGSLLSRFPYLGLKLAPGSAPEALVTPNHVPLSQVPFSAPQT